jgi:hypothetical protein
MESDLLKKMLRDILLARAFEECDSRNTPRETSPVFCISTLGEAAVAVGVLYAGEPADYIVTTCREQGHGWPAIVCETLPVATGIADTTTPYWEPVMKTAAAIVLNGGGRRDRQWRNVRAAVWSDSAPGYSHGAANPAGGVAAAQSGCISALCSTSSEQLLARRGAPTRRWGRAT